MSKTRLPFVNVRCPYCRAPKGERCHTRSGDPKSDGVHASRHRLSKSYDALDVALADLERDAGRTKVIDSETLSQLLGRLGLTHHPRRRDVWQGREVREGERVVFEGTANECWKWLRETGRIG